MIKGTGKNSRETNMDTWMQEPVDCDAHPAPSGAVGVKEREDERAEKPEIRQGGSLEKMLEAADKTEIAPSKAATIRAILKGVRESIDNALKLLDTVVPEAERDVAARLVLPVGGRAPGATGQLSAAEDGNERIVEGVFDGQNMVGDDGKWYSVPPNYASKSKLVEGDLLKLTITAKGNFIYKQIGPIERQRLVGTVSYEQDSGQHVVLAGGRRWRVLKASITYFRADVSDEAVILVPKNAPSKWAAVENIIKRPPQQSLTMGA